MTRIAASDASGTIAAHLPAKTRMSSSTIAWTMPAKGVRPPVRMFVAVRAMAPVAGMPPKIGDTTFATPCATSSMFDLCREPIMPSATTADSSDSIAASNATVSDGEISSLKCSSGTDGMCGIGKDVGTAPKREPIVSTGRLNSFGRHRGEGGQGNGGRHGPEARADRLDREVEQLHRGRREDHGDEWARH